MENKNMLEIQDNRNMLMGTIMLEADIAVVRFFYSEYDKLRQKAIKQNPDAFRIFLEAQMGGQSTEGIIDRIGEAWND